MMTQFLEEAAEGRSDASESEIADLTGMAYGGAYPQLGFHGFEIADNLSLE